MRNLAVTNNLPQVVLVELVGLEGQSELAGTGPPAQVVPAGATAGFDVHFKCHTEQVMLRAAVAAAASAPAPSVLLVLTGILIGGNQTPRGAGGAWFNHNTGYRGFESPNSVR